MVKIIQLRIGTFDAHNIKCLIQMKAYNTITKYFFNSEQPNTETKKPLLFDAYNKTKNRNHKQLIPFIVVNFNRILIVIFETISQLINTF